MGNSTRWIGMTKSHYHKGNSLWQMGKSWKESSWQPTGKSPPRWKWNASGEQDSWRQSKWPNVGKTKQESQEEDVTDWGSGADAA